MKLKSWGKFINILQFAFGWKKYTYRNLWEKIILLLGIKVAASFRLKYKYWPFTWHRKSDYFMHSVTYGDSFMHLDVCLGHRQIHKTPSFPVYLSMVWADFARVWIFTWCTSTAHVSLCTFCTIANMYWKQYVTLLNYIVTVTQWWKWNQYCAYFSRNESLPYALCKNLERRFYHDMFNKMLCYRVSILRFYW